MSASLQGQDGDGASFSHVTVKSIMFHAQPHQNRLLLFEQQVVIIFDPSERCECADDTADLAVAVAVFRLFFQRADKDYLF